MKLYDLPKHERLELVERIAQEIQADLEHGSCAHFQRYFSEKRHLYPKVCLSRRGRHYFVNEKLQSQIPRVLNKLFEDKNEHIRRTVVNAFREIGKTSANEALVLFQEALRDNHHSVRNAVIGSLKKMGGKNPEPVLQF